MCYFTNIIFIYLLLHLSFLLCNKKINEITSSFRCTIDKQDFFKGYLDHLPKKEIKSYLLKNNQNINNEYKDFNITID